MTKEVQNINRAIRELKKCNGDCKHCPFMRIDTADYPGLIAYAMKCQKVHDAGYTIYSETFRDLKQRSIEALEEEKSLYTTFDKSLYG